MLRALTVLLAFSVFFSAGAAEKKTNKGAFQMPKKTAAPAAGAPASTPAHAAASTPPPTPLPPAPNGGEDAAGPAGEDASAPQAPDPATPAAADKPALPPTAFTLPNRETPQTPEARSQPPAPAPAKRFSLPAHKPKKTPPPSFRLPQKSN